MLIIICLKSGTLLGNILGRSSQFLGGRLVETLVKVQEKDVAWTLIGVGNYVVVPEYAHFTKSCEEWHDMLQQESLKEIPCDKKGAKLQFCQQMVTWG